MTIAYYHSPTLGLFLSLSPGISPGFLYESFPANTYGGAKMPSKLYVGNLAYSVSNSDLEELFSQAGQVQSVAVITDKFSGQSKGFGFVEMANAEDASKAIQTLNDTDLKGRNIKVSEAKPRESSFGGGGGGGNRRGGGENRGGGGGGRW
ncbi:MAG: RNA-binding protein [Candidatus Binatus sp.]